VTELETAAKFHRTIEKKNRVSHDYHHASVSSAGQIAAFDRRVKFLGYKYGKKLIKSIGSGTT
jgi:hypothetical protein